MVRAIESTLFQSCIGSDAIHKCISRARANNMEKIILQLRESNPHFADAILNEFNNSNELLKNQYQLQFNQQQSQFEQQQAQLKAHFDELKCQNEKLLEQITSLTGELAKSNALFDDENRNRKIPNRNSNGRGFSQSTLNAFLKKPDSNTTLSSKTNNDTRATGNSSDMQINDSSNITSQGVEKSGENNGTIGLDENLVNSTGGIVQNKFGREKNVQPLLIEIGNGGIAALKNIISRHVKNDCYIIQHFNTKKPVKITPKNIETRNLIIDLLTNNKYQFSSFNNKNEKRKCYIMRGILYDIDCGEIRDALIATGCFDDKLEVTRLITGYQRKNPLNQHNLLYRIVVPFDFDTNKFKNINGIDGMHVKFEKFKSNGVLQCKNCQRFLHSASQCFYKHRCVKCNGDHLKNECPRNSNSLLPVSCCNCGGSHSANNVLECDYYKKNILPMIGNKNSDNAARGETSVNTKSITGNAKSWSSVVKSGNRNQQTNNVPSNGNLQIDALVKRFDQFLNVIGDLINTIKK